VLDCYVTWHNIIMLYVIPDHVVNGIFGGMLLITLFAGIIVSSSKTGLVGYSPWAIRQSRSAPKRYTDKSKLRLFFRLLLVHFAVVTLIGFVLLGLDLVAFVAGIIWGAFITLPAAYLYWYLVVVKVKDKDEFGPP
jgi:hypothetical protein